MNILDEIVLYKKRLLNEGYYEQKRQTLPTVDVSYKSKLIDQLRESDCIEVIAEIKSKSPTVSNIPERNLEEQILAYQKGGAAAISILTDEHYFNGSFERLVDLTKKTTLPVLCKDFIIDERQIDVAKQAGASIILLIVHILTDEALQRLYDYARQLNLEVLVEVHSTEELKRAHQLQPNLIGVNNRDLERFITDVTHTNTILESKREDIFYISESGIKTTRDIEQLVPSGIHGVLIGESLMKASDPVLLLQSFKYQRI
ncbi:indole-3-glycerol phosphate synthase TrpC [Staphylococcus chromogenes]|uniref:indole-3-glycerol phosphate synthase TrpC n=1 Tax=Staphylococcus sp. 11511212 TaxID=2714544 RepID=UPI0014021681|nr:indole-3-glycerol phosphate synthase TrpC [Staphylococcus sp. 11511212]NHM78330.1 indole-3-glycerol phosphate synthase TrpC [Staphylococcus sp. 11511212]